MSTFVAIKSAARSPKVGIGVKDITNARGTWVNVENPRNTRDLGRHVSVGQFYEVQPARYQLDTATVESGGTVTPRTGSLTLDTAAATIKYVQGTDAVYTKGNLASLAAGTAVVVPNATLPLVAAIGLNTSTPGTPTVAAVINNTAAATVLENRVLNAYGSLATFPAIDTTADRTWLALVWVPPSITTLTSVAATDIFTTGSSHGYSVGDPVWFSGLTGGAGLTANTVYYVASVPSATTFTVSATLGGASFDHTSNITVGTVQRQILAADVIDIRP